MQGGRTVVVRREESHVGRRCFSHWRCMDVIGGTNRADNPENAVQVQNVTGRGERLEGTLVPMEVDICD